MLYRVSHGYYKNIIIFIPLQQREFSVNLKSVSKLQPIKVLRSQYKMDTRRFREFNI